jgi:hypothetical protein
MWCPLITGAAVRSLAAAACACLCGLATAAGLSTTLANGQSLNVIESSTPAGAGFSFERRYPDGTRDRQFGPGGRVAFEMGSSGGVPTAVRTDTSGHILVAGSAPVADQSGGAVVVRFLATGQIDSRWGDQGHLRLPVATGGSLATDILSLPDGSLLVVGMVEGKGSQQASIWRIAASGQVDPLFGQQGAMLAIASPLAQVLSIQQGPDGSLWLAVQTSQDGKTWIEMHRWQSGDAGPLRVARQEMPDHWVGPASLVLLNGQWVWLDPSRPESPVAAAMLKEPDSPWVRAALPLTAAAAPAPADESLGSPGHAVMNPFAGAAIAVESKPVEPVATTNWLAIFAATVLVFGAMIWRFFRH